MIYHTREYETLEVTCAIIPFYLSIYMYMYLDPLQVCYKGYLKRLMCACTCCDLEAVFVLKIN